MLKVLAIAGSPRRGGNTDKLLDRAVVGAVSEGAQVKQIVLSDLEIGFCRNCEGCIQTGGICMVDDDMQWLFSDLREYDRFIFASPVYFMGIPAQAKAMIDRCQALWVIKYLYKKPVSTSNNVRKGVFISAGGAKYPNLFAGSIATLKSWFVTLDIEYAGELLFSGVDGYNAINDYPEALDKAFTVGKELVTN